MIQLTAKEHGDLLDAMAERDRLRKLVFDVRDQLSGALICTGPVQSIMIADAIKLIDQEPEGK